MVTVGFVNVAAVLIYAFGAGFLAQCGKSLLKRNVPWLAARPWWLEVFKDMIAFYTFWWLLRYGPINLGA